MLQELLFDGREQGLCTGGADPILKGPEGRAIRQIGRIQQTTEALIAAPIEHLILHLLIGQVVQALEHQYPHHGFRGVGWVAALRTDRPRCEPIHLGGKSSKVDMPIDPHQGITQLVDLSLVQLRCKQVRLDRALPWLHALVLISIRPVLILS